MRAGPLSTPETIQLLNEKFISTWVLNRNLKGLSGSNELAATVLAKRRPKSPVDNFVFTPALELVACEEANDFLWQRDPAAFYFRFLSEALSKANQ